MVLGEPTLEIFFGGGPFSVFCRHPSGARDDGPVWKSHHTMPKFVFHLNVVDVWAYPGVFRLKE